MSGDGSAGTAAGAATRPFLIGLTGPIGCGKSTVAGMLGRLGAFVVDADQVAREVTAPGQPATDAIRARFGEQLVDAAGVLDRGALARIVFADPDALADLEAIVHPAVRARIGDLLTSEAATAAPFVVVEAIKLVEGGLARDCDEVWLVTCEPEEQRRRLAGRGADDADAARRMAAQGDIRARLTPFAHRVLSTDGEPTATHERVEEALAEALAPVLALLPVRDPGAPRRSL